MSTMQTGDNGDGDLNPDSPADIANVPATLSLGAVMADDVSIVVSCQKQQSYELRVWGGQ